jgi:hypothetical protein
MTIRPRADGVTRLSATTEIAIGYTQAAIAQDAWGNVKFLRTDDLDTLAESNTTVSAKALFRSYGDELQVVVQRFKGGWAIIGGECG